VNGFFALFVKMTAKQETPSEQLRRTCQIYSRESLTSSFDTESDGTWSAVWCPRGQGYKVCLWFVFNKSRSYTNI
jgi:hypothetical protein